MNFKKIGILGGMGPAASAFFYSKIIEYCQQKYCAVQDTDYPPMVIYSLPLAGFDESGIVNEPLVLKQLVAGIKILEQAGCDFVVIPCNTVHVFIKELREKANIPILSIIEETIKRLRGVLSETLLLASENTIQKKLYIGFKHPNKKHFTKITALIKEIMGGSVKPETKDFVVSLTKNYATILLGCTELPLAITKEDVTGKLVSSLDLLAQAAVEYARVSKK